MSDEKQIRAFLAIDPPEEVLAEIGAIQSRLRKLITGEIRWVRPEGIHLTLKFFGDIFPSSVAEIAGAVEPLASGEKPFSLSIAGAGIFPDLRRPRVLWLGMNGDVERLIRFQTNLEQALQRIGFPREERPFRPHLTLARIKDSRALKGLDRALEKREEYTAGRFVAKGLCLIQSRLTPGGADYTPLRQFPFAG